MLVKIYHNARCSKSREAYGVLAEMDLDVTVIDYLKTPPSEKELKQLLKLLGIKAEALVRKSEALYKKNYKDKSLSEKQWLAVLTKNPILIERPVVVRGNKAVIARPAEKINTLFS